MQLTERVRRSESAVAQQTADETIVLHLQSGRYYGLDPVASFVWERLDGAADLASICTEIVRAFDVEPARANADLLDLVTELVEHRLVERLAD